MGTDGDVHPVLPNPKGCGTMAIDERQRHRLHERLDEVLGADEAAILMSHLPPVGWADVTTRHDLDSAVSMLRSDLSATESRLREEIGGLRGDMHQELGAMRADMLSNQRQMIFAIIASQFTAVSLAFAASSMAQ